ncbi:hypothetical protein [Streptomyces deserti]
MAIEAPPLHRIDSGLPRQSVRAVPPCRLPSGAPRRASLLIVVRAAPTATSNSPSNATIAATGNRIGRVPSPEKISSRWADVSDGHLAPGNAHPNIT